MLVRNKNLTLLFSVLLIVGGILLLESRKADMSGEIGDDSIILPADFTEDDVKRREKKAKKFEEGKEISTPDAFINVDDITISELVGEKVILVDFWTYSCINC